MFARKIASILAISLCFAFSLLAQGKNQSGVSTPTITPVAVGQEMFHSYCASCHGLDAKSGGPAAPALKSKPTDLTQLSKRNGGKFPLAMIESTVEGNRLIPAHGSREMPVWGEVFRNVNRDETLVKIKIHNLALYVESVQEKLKKPCEKKRRDEKRHTISIGRHAYQNRRQLQHLFRACEGHAPVALR